MVEATRAVIIVLVFKDKNAMMKLQDKVPWSFKYRTHNARYDRFFSVDPLTKDYPWNSPYAFSENRVIDAYEL